MSSILFLDRDMTPTELAQMNAGFEQHALGFGNPPVPSLRLGFVALDGETFIGCASGLANDAYRWFYLTDLFVEKSYRKQGLGALLLRRLEDKVAALGMRHIWTWTAGYEADGFYLKQGYTVFCEMEGWYVSGHSRVGLWKELHPLG
jgi:GNAT superfamily N-acetyltransferase